MRLYNRAIRFKNTVEDISTHIPPVKWLSTVDDFIGIVSGTEVQLMKYKIKYSSQIVSSTYSVSSVDVKVACSLILRSTCCSVDSVWSIIHCMLEGSLCAALHTAHGTSDPLVLFGDQVLRTHSSLTDPTFKQLQIFTLHTTFYF